MTAPKGWRSAQWLTPTEAAAVAGVSRSRFYQLTQAGEVPLVRDDRGRQRIRPADLQAWMDREGLGDNAAQNLDLFQATEDRDLAEVTADLAAWLASVADPDGVIRDPQAVAMLQEVLADG